MYTTTDEFELETQTLIPPNKMDEGLMNLTDAISSLIKKPTKKEREQFLADLKRLPIKINVNTKKIEREQVTPGNVKKITPAEFEQLKLDFGVRDEIMGLHQGLGGTLRLFLNENYKLNGQPGIFSFAEALKTVSLENNENVYSINLKIPIHGLDQGFNRWIVDQNGALKKIDLTQINQEFPKYIVNEKLKPICIATMLATIDCTVTPPKAKIKVTIESDCPQFKYDGLTNHANIKMNVQTNQAQKYVPPNTKPADIERSLEQLRSARDRARMLISRKSQSVAKHVKEKIQTPQSTGGKSSNAAQVSIQYAIDMNKFLKEKIIKRDKGFQVSLGESGIHQTSPVQITMEPNLEDKFNALVKALHVCGYQAIEKRSGESLQLVIQYKDQQNLSALEEKFNVFLAAAEKQRPRAL